MAKARVKKGDMVVVVSGKDRDPAKPCRVLQVMPARSRVLVEGVNKIKRHTRPNPQRNIKGGILEREAPIHVSNVMPIDPETKKPTRVGSKRLDDGKRVRVATRSGTMLDK
jgi:large subunit ribosomal protein L24